MKIKVIFLFVLLFMLLFAGTAYADSYNSGTGEVIITDPWAEGNLHTVINVLIGGSGHTATDVTSILILATSTANSADVNGLDNYVNLETLGVDDTVIFANPGNGFFRDHDVIDAIILLPSFSAIDYFASECDNLRIVYVPSAATFDDNCISYNPILEEVDLLSVTEFDNGCLRNNPLLTTVNLPAVTEVGNGFLRSNVGLTSLSMPVATTFGDNLCRNTDTLTGVNLPAAVTFGNSCFRGCDLLTSVSLPAATTFGNRAFRNNDKCIIACGNHIR